MIGMSMGQQIHTRGLSRRVGVVEAARLSAAVKGVYADPGELGEVAVVGGHSLRSREERREERPVETRWGRR